MKIYRMENRIKDRVKKENARTHHSALKMAAGGEDMFTISNEAIECYKKSSVTKLLKHDLKKLALSHIDDHSPWLDTLNREPEFVQAEKLARIAELVIRIAPSGTRDKIYRRVTNFVVEQLTGRS